MSHFPSHRFPPPKATCLGAKRLPSRRARKYFHFLWILLLFVILSVQTIGMQHGFCTICVRSVLVEVVAKADKILYIANSLLAFYVRNSICFYSHLTKIFVKQHQTLLKFQINFLTKIIVSTKRDKRFVPATYFLVNCPWNIICLQTHMNKNSLNNIIII